MAPAVLFFLAMQINVVFFAIFAKSPRSKMRAPTSIWMN
jgi:hypothetical protein